MKLSLKPETVAIIAGLAIVAIGIAGRWANGHVYSSMLAVDMISALADSALFLGSAIAGSSATTLALMLTTVAFVNRIDKKLDAVIYKQINRIALLSTISLSGSVILLLGLTLPVGEFEKLPSQWFVWLYDILYGGTVGLSALLAATIVLLYGTLRHLIMRVTPGDDEV